MRQPDLADCSGSLAFLESQSPLGESKLTPPKGDGAGGHQDHLLVTPAQPQQVLDQGLEPCAIEAPGTGIDQKGRADLDHHAPGLAEGGADARVTGHRMKTIRFHDKSRYAQTRDRNIVPGTARRALAVRDDALGWLRASGSHRGNGRLPIGPGVNPLIPALLPATAAPKLAPPPSG